MQLQDALDRFLLQLEADGRSPHTLAQYRRHVALFAAWAARAGHSGALNDVDEQLVARFFCSDTGKRRADGKPRKPAAANALRTSLRVFFGFCHEAAWAKRNAARLLRRALCSPPPPRDLSEKEMGKLMAALDEATTDAEIRDRALFRLLAETGMRIGSALGVEVADLDWEGGWVWLRTMKRQQVGRVALPGKTARMLRDWLGKRDSGAVFPRMSPRHAQRRFQMWLRRAGLSPAFSPHSLRHSFATRLYRETRDLLVVKEALLHRNLESTLVYAQGDLGVARRRAAH